MSSSKLVYGSIQPIQAKDIRFDRLQRPTVSVSVPLIIPNIHSPQLESRDPLRVKRETRLYAKEAALRVLEQMNQMPHIREAADVISLAMTVIHYVEQDPDMQSV